MCVRLKVQFTTLKFYNSSYSRQHSLVFIFRLSSLNSFGHAEWQTMLNSLKNVCVLVCVKRSEFLVNFCSSSENFQEKLRMFLTSTVVAM